MDTPLFTPEEIEALRADLVQPRDQEAESVDLASGDHRNVMLGRRAPV